MSAEHDAGPRPGDRVYVEWIDAETGEPFRALSGIFRLDARGSARLSTDDGNPDHPEYIGDPKLRVTVRERADERTALVERVALALACHDQLGGGMTDDPWWYVRSGAAEAALAPAWEALEGASRTAVDPSVTTARLRTVLANRGLISATGAAMASPEDLVDVVRRVLDERAAALESLRQARPTRVVAPDVLAALRTLAGMLGVPVTSSAPVDVIDGLARTLGRRHRRMCAALGLPEDTSPSVLAGRARELREPGRSAREWLDRYRDTLCDALGVKGLPTWQEVTGEITDLVDALNSSRDEVARLKRDGSPGVVHEVDAAFHRHAITQRDLAWERERRLVAERDEARRGLRLALDTLDTVRAGVAEGLGVPVEEVTQYDLNARVQELAARVRAVGADRDDTISLDEVMAAHDERERTESVAGMARALRGATWNRLEMQDGDGGWHLLWQRPADPEPALPVQRVWYYASEPDAMPDNPECAVVSPNGILWKWDADREEYVAWYAPGGVRDWTGLLKQYGSVVEAVAWFTPPVGWGNRIDEVLHFHGLRDEDYRNLSFALGNLIRSWIGSWAHDTDHAPDGSYWGPRSPGASAAEVAEIDLDATRYRAHRTYTDPAGLTVGGVIARCHDCAWSQPAGVVSARSLRTEHERGAEPVLVDTSKPLVFRFGQPEPHESITRVQVPNSQVFTRVPVGIAGRPVGDAPGHGGRVRLGWRWQAGKGALLRWEQVLGRFGTATELITPVPRPERTRAHRTNIRVVRGRGRSSQAFCTDCAWVVSGALNRMERERAEHESTAPHVPVD